MVLNFTPPAIAEKLYRQTPSRIDLLTLTSQRSETTQTTINVWRNHAFEPIQRLASPYFSNMGFTTIVRLSAYDDSLSLDSWNPADIDLFWVDLTRYEERSKDEVLILFDARLNELRRNSTNPILLLACNSPSSSVDLSTLTKKISGLFYLDLHAESARQNIQLIDERLEAVSGSKIGNPAQLMIARNLACKWIPATLKQKIKAIAIDLDNTLHSGILGEDGIEAVQVTSAHKNLQTFLQQLRKDGIFLSLISKNDPIDVNLLFERRRDYPLTLSDFSVVEVSWNNKSLGLQKIAKELNISTDAILFVDDNPGELAQVQEALPNTPAILATEDASLTARQIEFFPGIWRWAINDEDRLRVDDQQKNQVRKQTLAATTLTPQSQLDLNTHISVAFNQLDDLNRIVDLCNKTNQFNLCLRRLNETDAINIMNDPNAAIATIRLEDRFSNSGLIGVIVIQLLGDAIVIKELCISCRALGRNLEDAMIIPAIRAIPFFNRANKITFETKVGPRNEPAITWLNTLLKSTSTEISIPPTVSCSDLGKVSLPQTVTYTFKSRAEL